MVRRVVLLMVVLGSTRALAASPCVDGKIATVDTDGYCCWPGQVWSKQRAVCVGIPSCPAGYRVQGESCLRDQCPAGQSITPDTSGHCCWPNQAWSQLRQTCAGVPACPAGLAATGERCVPAPSTANAPPPPPAAAPAPPPAAPAPPPAAPAPPTAAPAPPTAAPAPPPPAHPQQPVYSPPQPVYPRPTYTPPAPVYYPTTYQPSGAAEPSAAVAKAAPAGPRNTRLSLVAKGLFGDVTGGGLELRIGIHLAKILRGPFPAELRLSIDPGLWGYQQQVSSVGLGTFTMALPLALEWSQRLGPVILAPRIGLLGAVAFAFAGADVSYSSIDLVGRVLAGIEMAVPSDDRNRFAFGCDFYFGQGFIASPWLGGVF